MARDGPRWDTNQAVLSQTGDLVSGNSGGQGRGNAPHVMDEIPLDQAVAARIGLDGFQAPPFSCHAPQAALLKLLLAPR